jgi:phosphoglycerate dehydrogenase-like enzyme
MNQQDTTVLVALTDKEWADFFPPPLHAELRGLFPRLKRIDPCGLDAAAWERLLLAEQPQVLIACWKTPPLPADLFSRLGVPLRYVCYLAGSVRKLVPDSLIEQGLLVSNWGNAISRVVAECGLMMAIACLRRATQWTLDMHLHGAWKDDTLVSCSLFERRVGLHGFGVIARDLRRLLLPFEVPVMTYSPSVPDHLLEECQVTRAHSLEQLFRESDVVFELAALTPANRHMVSEEHLRLLPDGGVFVNIGRGAVVDEDAILRVAREGNIQFALDVFEQEPLPADHPFRGIPNIMLLPHLGGPTIDRRQDCARLALRNLRAFLAGEPLEALINPEVYVRTT